LPLRKYIFKNKNLSKIINLGHYQVFKGITTYTCISLFEKNKTFEYIGYSEYSNFYNFAIIHYNDVFIDNKMYFSEINGLLKKILSNTNSSHAIVKNGYATLNDDVFIKDNFPIEIQPLIKIIKASTGKQKTALYPYDKNGKLICFKNLNPHTQQYLVKNLKYSNRND
jgi:adenine-specific DNA-methyltransferase